METLTIHASSSRGGAHAVTFSMDCGKLKVACACEAGRTGRLCRHRIALLAGDESVLADPGEAPGLQKALEWAGKVEVRAAAEKVAEAEREKETADKKLKRAKRELLRMIEL